VDKWVGKEIEPEQVQKCFGHQNVRTKRSSLMVTTKKLHSEIYVYELPWFLKGDTNIKYLQRMVKIKAWMLDNGELGPAYRSRAQLEQ
jgi:thymidylate synthase